MNKSDERGDVADVPLARGRSGLRRSWMRSDVLAIGAAAIALAGAACTRRDAPPATSVAPTDASAKWATGSAVSPIFGVGVPLGYRQWELVAPSHRPDFGELRAVLGNDLALKAYRSGTLPFPDGAMLAKLAWKHVPSAEVDTAFVPGAATTLQVMVKDSKKYASTGGWGFGRFVDGQPADEGQHQTCFACHQALVKNNDFVFTRLAP